MKTIVIMPEDIPRIKTLSFKINNEILHKVEELSRIYKVSKGNIIYQILTKGALNNENEIHNFFIEIVKNNILKKSRVPHSISENKIKEPRKITISCKFTKDEVDKIKILSKKFNISISQFLYTALKESLFYVKRN